MKVIFYFSLYLLLIVVHISQTKTLLENGEQETSGKIVSDEEKFCGRQGKGQTGPGLCGGEGEGLAELQEE